MRRQAMAKICESLHFEGAYAPATIKAYYTDLADFEILRRAYTPEPFPAAPLTVSVYLDGLAPYRSVSTIQRRMYATCRSLRLLRLRDPTQDDDVHLAMRRIMRSKSCRPKQAKALTHEYLAEFLDVQPDNPWGIRNRTIISLGYDILARRAEFVALMSDDIEESSDGKLRLMIRRSKTDSFGIGRLAFTSKRSSLRRGLEIEPLFCGIYQGRAINRSLAPDTIKQFIQNAARVCGIERIEADALSAHSLRVGAAQDLLRNGHDSAAIMRAGGWKSINVMVRYLEFEEHNVWA